MMALSGSGSTSLKLLLDAAIFYVVYKVVQRLFFHPLAKVPGPWYAAISTIYEFWWDCPKQGKYMFKIEDMHKKYGTFLIVLPAQEILLCSLRPWRQRCVLA